MTQKIYDGRVVTKSVPKKDALSLAMGKPMYTDDKEFRNLAHVKMLYSPHALAEIEDIDVTEADKLQGVLSILTYKNCSQVLHTSAGQGYPEPSPYDMRLFNRRVKYVGDRVAAVAAETLEIAEQALDLIKVKYKVFEPIFDHDKSIGHKTVIHNEGEAKYIIPVFYDASKNHASHLDADVGDIEKGFKEADVIVEKTVRNHYGQRILAQILEIPLKQIRVIKPRIGGGFGAKQELITEPIAASFAWELKRPVKFELTRKEEFISARTRHPMTTYFKAGVKKDGTITAMDMKVTSNTGAYGSHALTVLSNTGSKTLPLYHCDNIRFIGNAVYTNLPVGGAYRGYGATQAALGMEIVMDELALAINMDPAKFRLMNHIKEGETSPIFKALGEGTEGVEQTVDSVGLTECINQGADRIDWWNREENKKKHNSKTKKRGYGLVCLMQGSSIPYVDMAGGYAKMNEDGS
ncbi:MAG: xanthine dehydrogenase family protein molybdopterin-binding subunit, partial [Candidatus Hodarchaeales archaeon]